MKVECDTSPPPGGTERPVDALHRRFSLTQNVYGTGTKSLRKNLEEIVKERRAKQRAVSLKRESIETGNTEEVTAWARTRKSVVPTHHEESVVHTTPTPRRASMATKTNPAPAAAPRLEQHKEGVARAHHAIRLQPLPAKTGSLVGASSQQSYNIAPGNTTSNLSFPSPPESKNPALQKLFQRSLALRGYPDGSGILTTRRTFILSPYTEKLSRKTYNHSQSSFNLFGNKRSLINPSLRPQDLTKSADIAKENGGTANRGSPSASTPPDNNPFAPNPKNNVIKHNKSSSTKPDTNPFASQQRNSEQNPTCWENPTPTPSAKTPAFSKSRTVVGVTSLSSETGAPADSGFQSLSRSKTSIPMAPEASKIPIIRSPAMLKLEKKARKEAEKAIKDRKIFMILGPYHSLRLALRRRGWVEKFQNAPSPAEIAFSNKYNKENISEEADFVDSLKTEPKQKPWAESNGIYAMMSHVVRNCTPALVFAVKSVDVDSRVTKSGQLVNHFGKARTFTTKVGLSSNIRNSTWFNDTDNDSFYPRCYKLEDCDEREAFIDDFKMTACTGFLKCFVIKYKDVQNQKETQKSSGELSPIDETSSDKQETLSRIDETSNDKQETLPRIDETNSDKQETLSRIDETRSDKQETNSDTAVTPSQANCDNSIDRGPSTPEVVQKEEQSITPYSDQNISTIELAPERSNSAPADRHGEENGEDLHRRQSLPNGCHEPITDTTAAEEEGVPTTTISVENQGDVSVMVTASPPVAAKINVRRGGPDVPIKAFHIAMQQTGQFLKCKEHDDIDTLSETHLSSSQWEQFLNWYYEFIHAGGEIKNVTVSMVERANEMLSELKERWAQYELDGFKNVWILKPGAKSRGRGIQCMDHLDDILGTIDSTDSLVAQKYIERPLLVYNTKFDIRQWFLVTDWNPLTVWFYNDCYLRFCSQEFTLDNFHESIHLSNNSIQKHYNIHQNRSLQLPDDNMWTSQEFELFLRRQGCGDVWQDKVLVGMKNAITSTLLCTQEFIEIRKSAFELYGADFMMTEDMDPWLIEINSSPSMARTTRATAQMVDRVLEDTLKVVLDRKFDRSSDTGGFECIYRQSLITDPPPLDNTNLTVNGKKIKRKGPKR